MGRDLFLCRQQKRKLDLELDPFLTPRPGDLIQKKLLLLLPWVPKGCRIIRVKGLDLLFLPSQTSKEALSLTSKRVNYLSLEPFQMLVLDPSLILRDHLTRKLDRLVRRLGSAWCVSWSSFALIGH